jgi:HAD superfamily hydrolase (TIGR01509 family)
MTREIMDEAESRDGRLLICDCDGVLIDSETIAAQMLVRELAARWPDADVEPAVLPLLGLRIERVLEQSAATLGRTLDAGDIDAIRRVVEAAALEAPVVVGVEAALSQIPLVKACASNSYTGYVEAVLARTGLGRFFGTRLFCADRVARPKPAPDVYIAAANALGVAREACLVIEDSAAGVTAARAAGMRVLGFAGGGHATRAQIGALVEAGAKHVFDDMRELPALVDRWLDARVGSTRVETDMKGDESWQA